MSGPRRVSAAVRRFRAAVRRRRAESGQVSVLILGMVMLAMLLIVGGVDVTAAQLARVRLVDAADAAALDAADALDEATAYRSGLSDAVVLSSATVKEAAAAYLSVRPKPEGCGRGGSRRGRALRAATPLSSSWMPPSNCR